MMLTLTRDEWDRIDADGRGVLFRPGVRHLNYNRNSGVELNVAPAEFVVAAQACETCGGRGWHTAGGHDPMDCGRCDADGKRRIAAVVPCETCGHHGEGCWNPYCDDGFETVGHVVVTWGPLVVVGTMKDTAALAANRQPHLWIDRFGAVLVLDSPSGMTETKLTLPPDVDPQSLIGKYALGVEVS